MFHGSPIGNWHSILRKGLLTSGFQGLGSSGQSIWMANDFTTSIGYSTKWGNKGGWDKSRLGNDLLCMAILEVVNDSGKGVSDQNSVCVVSDTSIISTRYFLVFKGSIQQTNVRAVSLPMHNFEEFINHDTEDEDK
jgi:ubiquitin-conjugating enzyme E2 Q